MGIDYINAERRMRSDGEFEMIKGIFKIWNRYSQVICLSFIHYNSEKLIYSEDTVHFWHISSKLGKYRIKSGLTLFIVQLVKNPPTIQETWVQSLGWEDALEKGKAAHSTILAWRIPWTFPQCHKESEMTEPLSLSAVFKSSLKFPIK